MPQSQPYPFVWLALSLLYLYPSISGTLSLSLCPVLIRFTQTSFGRFISGFSSRAWLNLHLIFKWLAAFTFVVAVAVAVTVAVH